MVATAHIAATGIIPSYLRGGEIGHLHLMHDILIGLSVFEQLTYIHSQIDHVRRDICSNSQHLALSACSAGDAG